MKVGSLVVCVDNTGFIMLIPPDKDKIYTVRGIHDSINIHTGIKGKGITLEEITNGNNEAGELCYASWRFRELDTPQSISIEEILEEPVYA